MPEIYLERNNYPVLFFFYVKSKSHDRELPVAANYNVTRRVIGGGREQWQLLFARKSALATHVSTYFSRRVCAR